MSVIADLRFSVRRLCRSPGFALSTISMLAIGIALSVAMFSMLSGVLLAGLPYPGGDRVVSVGSSNAQRQIDRGGLTPAEVESIATLDNDPRSPFRHFGYFNWGGISLFNERHPREISIVVVSAGFFPALGMQPLHGRWFTAEEHAERPYTSAVLSYAEWQRVFGGRADAIGQSIDTSEGRLRVVGVMPPAFAYPTDSIGAYLPRSGYDASKPSYQHARFVSGVGLLQTDLSSSLLQKKLDALMGEVRERHSLADDGSRFFSIALLDELVGEVRGTLWGVFAISMLVLLIACANVAILFDARQIERMHEQTLTIALGASRERVWRIGVFELLMVTMAGVSLGVLTAGSMLKVLRQLAEGSVPRAAAIELDPIVLGFAIALALLTPFTVLAAGALRRTRGIANDLRAGARSLLAGEAGTRPLLPALAIALSTVSLVAAGAFSLSLMRLRNVDPGFRSEHIFALQLYRDGDPQTWNEYAEQIRTRLAALPGVEHAALTSVAPLSNNGSMTIDLQLPGRSESEPYVAGVRFVDAGYLPILGIPLLAGRNIESTDRQDTARVAVINQALARRSFGAESPLGQTIRLPLGQGDRIDYRVVGVMSDIRNNGLRAPSSPEILVPIAQSPRHGMTFLIRTRTALPGMERLMAEQVWAVDPRQAFARQFTLSGELDNELHTIRFFSYTVAAFALSALLLGAFGVYAVAAQQQRRRAREFGLRLAVGASPATLSFRILRDGLVVAGAGATTGLVGAWFVLQLIADQTFGLEHQLPWLVATCVAAMGVVALAALMLPALRAAKTDPMRVLKD